MTRVRLTLGGILFFTYSSEKDNEICISFRAEQLSPALKVIYFFLFFFFLHFKEGALTTATLSLIANPAPLKVPESVIRFQVGLDYFCGKKKKNEESGKNVIVMQVRDALVCVSARCDELLSLS